MLKKNISGQYLYFTLVSALSGNAVTGASGSISGRKSLDGLSGMIVLSGNVIELGGGSYRANLFDFDTNGDYAGFLFTASGCVPVQYSMVTLGGISGGVYPASGVNSVVPPATLSGVVVNSGAFVTVLPANLSGLVVNSGLFVTVPKATLSGVVANSGLFVTVLPENLSGVFATAEATVASGVSVIATIYSGQMSGHQITARTVTDKSGYIVGGAVSGSLSGALSSVWDAIPVSPASGSYGHHVWRTSEATVGTYGSVSDAAATTTSFKTTLTEVDDFWNDAVITFTAGALAGQSRVISDYANTDGLITLDEALTSAPADASKFVIRRDHVHTKTQIAESVKTNASGMFVTLPKATISGLIVNSGAFVTVPPATLSGVVVNSGLFTVVSPSSLSGLVVNSGLFVTVPPATLSGVVVNSGLFATVLPANLSGVVANSGLFSTVLPANLSGVIANSGLFVSTASGLVFPNSGLFANALTHNFSGLSAASGTRCLLNASRKLTNKWDLSDSSGYLSVYEEDDSTVAYKQAVTSASGAEPVTGLDS